MTERIGRRDGNAFLILSYTGIAPYPRRRGACNIVSPSREMCTYVSVLSQCPSEESSYFDEVFVVREDVMSSSAGGLHRGTWRHESNTNRHRPIDYTHTLYTANDVPRSSDLEISRVGIALRATHRFLLYKKFIFASRNAKPDVARARSYAQHTKHWRNIGRWKGRENTRETLKIRSQHVNGTHMYMR